MQYKFLFRNTNLHQSYQEAPDDIKLSISIYFIVFIPHSLENILYCG